MTGVIQLRKIPENQLNLQVTSENHLGSGGFGFTIKTIYAGTPVAAKTLHILSNPGNYGLFPDGSGYQDVVREFEQELSINANLSHPNVIQLIGVVFDEQNSTPKWMIQELGDTSLDKELQHNYLLHHKPCNTNNNLDNNQHNINTLKVKFEILRDVLRGLSFMHHNNVVHRDLKPSNIIKVNNTYKLADFGIAKILHNSQKCLNTPAGTPDYVAPEVGTSEEYTLKCDIYSFGVTMIQLILNEPPSREDRPSQLNRAIQIVIAILSSVPSPSSPENRNQISNNHNHINNNNNDNDNNNLEERTKQFITSLIALDYKTRPTAMEALRFIEHLYATYFEKMKKTKIHIHNYYPDPIRVWVTSECRSTDWFTIQPNGSDSWSRDAHFKPDVHFETPTGNFVKSPPLNHEYHYTYCRDGYIRDGFHGAPKYIWQFERVYGPFNHNREGLREGVKSDFKYCLETSYSKDNLHQQLEAIAIRFSDFLEVPIISIHHSLYEPKDHPRRHRYAILEYKENGNICYFSVELLYDS